MQVQDAYKLQDYFTILHVLKIFDDVLILTNCVQVLEKLPYYMSHCC